MTVVIVAFITIIVVVDVNGTDRDYPEEGVEEVNCPSTSRGRDCGLERNTPCGKGGGGDGGTWTISARCSSSTDTYGSYICIPFMLFALLVHSASIYPSCHLQTVKN